MYACCTLQLGSISVNFFCFTWIFSVLLFTFLFTWTEIYFLHTFFKLPTCPTLSCTKRFLFTGQISVWYFYYYYFLFLACLVIFTVGLDMNKLLARHFLLFVFFFCILPTFHENPITITTSQSFLLKATSVQWPQCSGINWSLKVSRPLLKWYL